MGDYLEELQEMEQLMTREREAALRGELVVVGQLLDSKDRVIRRIEQLPTPTEQKDVTSALDLLGKISAMQEENIARVAGNVRSLGSQMGTLQRGKQAVSSYGGQSPRGKAVHIDNFT